MKNPGTFYLVCFTILSLCAGYLHFIPSIPDAVYFILRQASEVFLLLTIYILSKKHKSIRVLSGALLALSMAELLDELLGYNTSLRINDVAFILIALWFVYNSLTNKTDGGTKYIK